MGHPLRNSWWKKNWPGQVRSRIYDVIRGTASDRLFKEIVFSVTKLAAIDWNGDFMHSLGQQMTTSDLWHRILTFHSFIRGNWLWLTPFIPIVINLAVLGVSWGPETEYVAIFFAWIYLWCLSTLSYANQGHWPSLPSGDFADGGDAAPFRDTVRHKYSIKKL